MNNEEFGSLKIIQVMLAYKETDRGLSGINWTLRDAKNVTTEQFWYWDKEYSVDYNGYTVTGAYHFIDFGE